MASWSATGCPGPLDSNIHPLPEVECRPDGNLLPGGILKHVEAGDEIARLKARIRRGSMSGDEVDPGRL